MPLTLKYLFRAAKTKTGGSIMITQTAMTGPQSVTFCWLIKLDRAMCCSRLRPAGAGEYTPTLSVVVGWLGCGTQKPASSERI